MLRNSFRLLTIRGIEVGVHYSWLLIFGLVTFTLAQGVFPDWQPGLSTIDYWVTGLVGSLLFFASVLLHELAHSFVALSRGLQAKSITLFIFGGVSNLGGEAKSASTEFVVAIVGPLTSFLLAGLSYVVAELASEPHVEVVASYLLYVNFGLGLFNLVPGFPLDGGRVLRAILWTTTGSVRKATEWAANVGKIVAYGLFALAVFLIVGRDIVTGIWFGAIAWFLHNAASASVAQLVFETRLRKVKAGDIVTPDDATVAPGATIAELVDQYLLPGNRRAVAVTDNGRLVGIVTVTDVARVAPEARNVATVAEVMGGRDGLVTVRADQPVQDAVEIMADRDVNQVPVVDGPRLVGLLTRADVMRQLQLREALDI